MPYADTGGHYVPTVAMLDVWLALGGTQASFDRMWAEDRRTPADTWAQLRAVISGNWVLLAEDTNPPMGPEFALLILSRTDRPVP